jgi:uncharacterized protein
MDVRYSFTGLLVGFLIGLTGMGGGSLMTPLLIFLLGVQPTVAVGSDLAYAAVTKVVGALQHARQQTVHRALAWQLAMGSVPGSVAGVWWMHRLHSRLGEDVQQIVMHLLAVMLILVALVLFVWGGYVARESLQVREEQYPNRPVWAVVGGLVLGFLVGVTSVGSGTLFGVILLFIFGLSVREMIGTDIYHAAILATAAAAAHAWVGNVDYILVASLLLGSIPGVLLGSRLTVKAPEKALRPLVAVILFLCALRML